MVLVLTAILAVVLMPRPAHARTGARPDEVATTMHPGPTVASAPVDPALDLGRLPIADLRAYSVALDGDIARLQVEIHRRPIARYRAIVGVGWAGLGVASYLALMSAIGVTSHNCYPCTEAEWQRYSLRYGLGVGALALVSTATLVAGYSLVVRQHRRRRPFILQYRELLKSRYEVRTELGRR